jgi:hypothetical protein
MLARHLQFKSPLSNHHIVVYSQLLLAKSPQNQ